jgi:hypothetical protein
MKNVPAHEILERIFKVLLREAEQNPGLARRVFDALPTGVLAAIPPAGKGPRKRIGGPQLHAINILRTHGEAVLRGKLEQVRSASDLIGVAKLSGLVLTGRAGRAKPSRGELIEGIIAAAKHYDAQRTTAAALTAELGTRPVNGGGL